MKDTVLNSQQSQIFNNWCEQIHALKRVAKQRGMQKWATYPWYLLLSDDDLSSALWRAEFIGKPLWQSNVEQLNFFLVEDRIVLVVNAMAEPKLALFASVWPHFLRYLRRQRLGRPIDGVIISCSTHLFNHATGEILTRLLQLLVLPMQRLSFGRLPLYLVVTACEALLGFEDFFNGLNPGESNNLLGFVLSNTKPSGNVLEQFDTEMLALSHTLAKRGLYHLSHRADLKHNLQSWHFVSEFLALKELISNWLQTSLSVFNHPKSTLRAISFSGRVKQQYFLTGFKQLLQQEVCWGSLKTQFKIKLHQKKRWLSLLIIMLTMGIAWAELWHFSSLAKEHEALHSPSVVAAPISAKEAAPPKPIIKPVSQKHKHSGEPFCAIPAFTLMVEPWYLSKNLAQFTLTIGKDSFSYAHGPRFVSELTWPNSEDAAYSFTPLSGQSLTRSFQGPRALLDLLQSGRLKSMGQGKYMITFSLGEYAATYQINLVQGNLTALLAKQQLCH